MRDVFNSSFLFSSACAVMLGLFAFYPLSLQGKEGHSLQTKQIQPIMRKIFAEHLDQRGMNPLLMQQSIRLYIQQFDPQFLYLLRSEVKPYWDIPPANLDRLVKEYNAQNYIIFEQLDALFADAIKRARRLRALDQKSKNLFSEKSEDNTPFNPSKLQQFAETPQILEERWRNQLQAYLQLQTQRFGDSYVVSKRDMIFQQLEEGLAQREQFYLAKEGKNTLSPADQQHYFSLHVLKAITSSLDPHSAFFDDSEAFSMKTHLDKGFEGLGIFLIQTPEGFIIKGLVQGGAAEKSGLIHSGDRLVRVRTEAIPDQPVEGKSLEQALQLLRSDHAHPVTLVLKTGQKSPKPDEWVEVRLTPQKITLNDDRVTSGYVPFEDGILGWIALNSFYEGDKGVSSTEDVHNSIEALRKKGQLKGLVLDLRKNGGGYLSQAVKLVGLFIKSGVVVIAKYNDGMQHTYRDLQPDREYDGPLLLLTSRVTASAAEIVAQALQNYGVALIAGDGRTYGKGTIQSQNVTNDASTSYFKVTVGKYYTVSGKTAQLNGVISDLIVPGPYSLLPIGEAYLQSPLPSDQIAAAFDDSLDDVDLFTRQWYMYSYVPYLQSRTSFWRQMLPQLRRANQDRIASSPGYQRFLRAIQLHSLIAGDKKQRTRIGEMGPFSVAEEQQELKHGVPPLVPGDIQLSEALLIVKDMAELQAEALQAQ